MIIKVIRKRRRELEMSQAELARRVGCARQHIVNIENGHTDPSREMLEKIMAVLDLEITTTNRKQ